MNTLHIICLYVLISALWCSIRFLHINDVRFVFASSCLYEGSCLIYVICVCLGILVSTTLLYFCFVFLCLVYLILPVSLDCSFLIVPSVFSNVYLQIRVVYLQSSRRAWSDLAVSDISWSMIPSGRPINSCSASIHSRALSCFDILSCCWLVNSSRNVYTATCSEAELETPPPNGTEDTITASNEHTWPGIHLWL
jgi:hypothetical protein